MSHDDKEKDKKKCISAGDFTVEICEKKKEKPPKKEEPIAPWKLVVTLSATLAISFQLIDGDRPVEPDVVVKREDRIDEVIITTDQVPEERIPEERIPEERIPEEHIPEEPTIPLASSDPTSTPTTTTPVQTPVQTLELTTRQSVETLHTTIRQALIREDYGAIAPLLTNSYYWIGTTYAPLDVTVLTDIESPVMRSLEKAIAAGCLSHGSSTGVDLTPSYWVCPGTVDRSHLEHITTATTVLISGDQVNIRQGPSLDSEVITSVSFQTVVLNQGAIAVLSDAERGALVTASGWCPILLQDGQAGYVSSQFCRPITQAHALLRNVDGQWRMTVVAP